MPELYRLFDCRSVFHVLAGCPRGCRRSGWLPCLAGYTGLAFGHATGATSLRHSFRSGRQEGATCRFCSGKWAKAKENSQPVGVGIGLGLASAACANGVDTVVQGTRRHEL